MRSGAGAALRSPTDEAARSRCAPLAEQIGARAMVPAIGVAAKAVTTLAMSGPSAEPQPDSARIRPTLIRRVTSNANFGGQERCILGRSYPLLRAFLCNGAECVPEWSVAVDDLDLPFAVSQIGARDGEPVVVLPGGPCRGFEYLGDLAGLAGTYNLVVLRPRGTPLSGGLSHGWWADADDVVALADALGVRQVRVVAHSAATRLALAVAARFPDRLQSLALVTPPASWLSGTTEDAGVVELDRDDPEVADALEALELGDPDTDAAFVRLFRRQAAATYAHWTRHEQAHAGVGVMNLAAVSAWFTDIPVDVVSRICGAVMPPTLVIGGGNDVLTGRQPVVDYARALHAELAVIDDCGHYPWVEQPDAFYRIVDDWLTGEATPARPPHSSTVDAVLPD